VSETAIRYAPALAVATIFFLLALDGGTFSLSSRNTAAIAIWWALLLAVLARALPLATPPRAGLAAGGALAGMAVLSLLSATWGASAERAFVEFDRVALYVGAFLLTLFVATRGSLGRWLDGLALTIVAVGLVALTSRLLPDLVSPGEALALLPASQNRVSFPLGYWNGLAILLALGFPLLLRTAMVARPAPVRSLAIGVLPALAGVIYLTSSRGGVVTALIGALAFVGLASRRLHALAWLGLVGIASGAVVAVLRSRPGLVTLPGTPLAESEGRSAAAALRLGERGAGKVHEVGPRAKNRDHRAGGDPHEAEPGKRVQPAAREADEGECSDERRHDTAPGGGQVDDAGERGEHTDRKAADRRQPGDHRCPQ